MRSLFLLAVLLLPGLALADTTVAVLPLQQGASSEPYEGLGTALSGMLVADLSGVPGLVLVERQHLDAVLSEIDLSKTGYLDPATAQKLGKGLGAQDLVTGSWSVAGGKFLMDARLVEVRTGRVVTAAKADGGPQDFVAVEKKVVQDLLSGLKVALDLGAQRRLLLRTPTESFPAFAAYGKGVALQGQGKLDDAAKAFEKALSADPDFEQARTSLAAIQEQVARRRAEDAATQVSDRARRLRAVLAGTTDERTVKPGHHDTLAELSAWSLRLLALRETGQDCERMQEMQHYLQRVKGEVRLPPAAHRPYALVTSLSQQAWALGLEKKEYPTDTYTRDIRIMDAASILGSVSQFVLDLDEAEPGHPKSKGLYSSMARCLPAGAVVPAVRKLRDQLRNWGVDQRVDEPRADPAVTVGDLMEVLLLRLHVRDHGFDDEVKGRVQALLDRHAHDAARQWATSIAQRLVSAGVDHERLVTMRQGLPEDVLLGMARAVAAQDPKLVRTGSTFCAVAVPKVVPSVESALAQWKEEREGRRVQYAPWALARTGTDIAPLMDFGCIAGIPARFDSPAAAIAWVAKGRERANPDTAKKEECVDAWRGFLPDDLQEHLTGASPEYAATIALIGLQQWYALEAQGCALPSRKPAAP